MTDRSTIEIGPVFSADESLLRLMNTHEVHYSGISKWFAQKVLPQLSLQFRRALYVARDGDDLVGVAIGRRRDADVKLCHLWVSPAVRGKRVGLQLFRVVAYKARLGGRVYFTVPESAWADVQPLFLSFGFKVVGKAKRQYRGAGNAELVCAAQRDVIRANDRWDCEICEHWILEEAAELSKCCRIGYAPPPVCIWPACPKYQPSLPRLVARQLGKSTDDL